MRWKEMLCLVLPLAAFVGTWLGLAVDGGAYSQNQVVLLFLFACWVLISFWAYFSCERARMNRSRGYR